MADIGNHAAERGCDTRITRHECGLQADILDQSPACSAPPPPKGTATNFAGSCPRSMETRTDGAGHAAVCDTHDRFRRLHDAKATGPRDMLSDGGLGRLDVEPRQLAADRPLRIDAAQHDIGVRQGRGVLPWP